MSRPIILYVDADACPVKQEVYRVAERFVLRGTALKVIVVANSPIMVPRADFIERIVVGAGMDEADNFIAERAQRGDVVITADVPLAARAVKAGAEVDRAERQAVHRGRDRHGACHPQPDERPAQRRRDHRPDRRPFAAQDRSRFLSGLDAALTRLTRTGFGQADDRGWEP